MDIKKMVRDFKLWLDPDMKGYFGLCDFTRICKQILILVAIIAMVGMGIIAIGALSISAFIGEFIMTIPMFIASVLVGIVVVIIYVALIAFIIYLWRNFIAACDYTISTCVVKPVKIFKRKVKWCKIKICKINHT